MGEGEGSGGRRIVHGDGYEVICMAPVTQSWKCGANRCIEAQGFSLSTALPSFVHTSIKRWGSRSVYIMYE